MSADAIESEVVIQADIDRVWSLVSKAGFWCGRDLRFDFDAVEGASVAIDDANYGRFWVEVVKLDPRRYAAYRWTAGIPTLDLTTGTSTPVEFTLVNEPSGVLVKVKESGFSALSDDATRERKFRENTEGWAIQLASLKRTAEAALVS